MFPEAVARYHDLLSNEELAESSRVLLDEGLEKAKLIFGGRRLSPYLRPHFVSETDFARICRICETVWSAIQKVKDAAVADPNVVNDLGLTEIERELVSDQVSLQFCRTQRRESGRNRLCRCRLRHFFVTSSDERVCDGVQPAAHV